MNNYKYYFDAYFDLIEFTDEKIKALEDIHSKDIVCKKGCLSCCSEMTVLPIEFYALLSKLKEENKALNLSSESCSFLSKSLCQIYELRPLICRTHGLPLGYCDDEDPSQKNISFCHLNFTGDLPEFNENNILDMDEINIELVRLNEQFLKIFDGDLPERIDLKELANVL